MKINYICDAVLPSRAAAGIQASAMCNAMGEQGHDVELLAAAPRRRPAAVHGRHSIRPAVRVATHRMPPVRGGGQVFAMRCALRARHRGADLVYSRHMPSAYAGALLGLPVVFESHSPEPYEGRGAFTFRRLLAHRNLRLIVVPSGALARYYRYELGLRDDPRLLVAPNAARDFGSAQTAPAGGRPAVGVVTNMHRGRGLDIVRTLAEGFPGTDFHIVGGEDRYLARWEEAMGRLANVTFHGFVEPSHMGAHYRLFDIALAPYCGRVTGQGDTGNNVRYMSPTVLVEYLSAGKSVVCSNLPALRELVRHEHDALLCDPGAVDEWGDALQRLLDDRDLRMRLAGNARASYLGRGTIEQRARSILGALRP